MTRARDNATVVFTVDWPGSEPKQACETEAKAGGAVWECEVDLAALKAPSGRLRVDFDVDRGSGQVDDSPDGKRTLDYQPPGPDLARRAGRSCQVVLLPALAVDRRSAITSPPTCGDTIRYAEGAATGAWSSKTFRSRPPTTSRPARSSPSTATPSISPTRATGR